MLVSECEGALDQHRNTQQEHLENVEQRLQQLHTIVLKCGFIYQTVEHVIKE